MKFYIAVVSFLTEVPVLSQAFLRSARTQYRRVPCLCGTRLLSKPVEIVKFLFISTVQ